jgi:hypothetical protein
MRRLIKATAILIAAGILLPMAASAATFGVKTNSKVLNIDNVNGEFRQFNFRLTALNDYGFSFTLTNDSGYVDMTGRYVGARLSKTNATYVSWEPSLVTINNSNVTFTLAASNIPPVNSYEMEIFGWEGVSTNFARTLGQGQIRTDKSLYTTEDAYPWATGATNLAGYLTIAAADSTYFKLVNGNANAATNESQWLSIISNVHCEQHRLDSQRPIPHTDCTRDRNHCIARSV